MSSCKFTLFIVLVGIAGTSQAASFDCAKARSKVEKAICGDSELSKLDDELAVVYKSALVIHPLPSYVRARQREWLRLLPDADFQRLKQEYRSRIAHLKNVGQAMVYSDARQTFSHDNGDTAVELSNGDGKRHLTVWGGARINETQGYTCEFEGRITEPFNPNGKNLAINQDDGKVAFVLTEDTFRFVGAPDICVGMGSIPADLELKRVLRK